MAARLTFLEDEVVTPKQEIKSLNDEVIELSRHVIPELKHLRYRECNVVIAESQSPVSKRRRMGIVLLRKFRNGRSFGWEVRPGGLCSI